MKKAALLLLIMLTIHAGKMQIQNPVRWSCTVKKTGNKEDEMHIASAIERTQHTIIGMEVVRRE